MSPNRIELGINIDHVATVRQARRAPYPDPVHAALLAEQAGADNITLHLREDRRHIQDRDVHALRPLLQTRMNLEMGLTPEMVDIAVGVRPQDCCLVPEKRQEITTEGGLDVVGNFDQVKNAVTKLRDAGIFVSIFIDPVAEQIDGARGAGAQQVELCTAEYAELTLSSRASHGPGEQKATAEIARIREAAVHAKSIGLIVAAGHGLTTRNVGPLAAIPEITEFNIGHHIISSSIFVGLENAVIQMINAIRRK